MNKDVRFRLTLEDITSRRPAALHFFIVERETGILLCADMLRYWAD